MEPTNVIMAATHPDPYPYYAGLVEADALSFDAPSRTWVAASAASVMAVFANPDCAVRPAAEPVPRTILHSRAGDVFGYLVRMNDGAQHAAPKLAIQRALAAVDLAAARQGAHELLTGLALSRDLRRPEALTGWTHDAPIHVIGRLLGFGDIQLPQLAAWMGEFVACLSPLSSEQQIAGAARAAAALLDKFRELLHSPVLPAQSLAGRVRAEAEEVGWNNADALLANLIGLLSQTYDATAGLIGNTIVAMATQPGLAQALRMTPERIQCAVEETGRFDPPVQNTRRFVTRPTVVAGTALQPGDVILLLLAAANRDPLLNDRPHEFLVQRSQRRTVGFGHGIHACPGQMLACTVAAAAIRVALELPTPPDLGALAWRYRPSVNGRIPVFIQPATQEQS